MPTGMAAQSGRLAIPPTQRPDAFRLGLADAEILEKEFYPEFSATDLIKLPNYRIYLKLMVDGVVSRPFSAATL